MPVQYGSEAELAAAEAAAPSAVVPAATVRQMKAAMQPARRTVRCYIHMSVQDSPGKRDFFSLYSHGFARVAAAVPHLRIAEPEHCRLI